MFNENLEAWNKETYDAWITRFGTASAYAEKLKSNPEAIVGALLPFMGAIENKKVLNVMGSNGNKAVALALMGADATVVDFSEGNKAYALDLAKAAGVSIDYVVSDILELPATYRTSEYDIAFAEMGILHYFQDLEPFFKLLKSTLKKGGTLIVRDFHPISTKLIVSRGSTAKVRKHKVEGDYFSTELIEKEVAYSKYSEEASAKVYLRQWTLGEIVTAVANAGFRVTALIEEPNRSSDVFDKGIPKTFTLTAVVDK